VEGLHVYYEPYDRTGNRTAPYNITRWDLIHVTGIIDDHFNGEIWVNHRGTVLTHTLIPETLLPDGEMELIGQRDHSVYVNNEAMNWEFRFTPNITREFSLRPYWSTIRAGIIGADGSVLVEPKPFTSTRDRISLENKSDVKFHYFDYHYENVFMIGDMYGIDFPDKNDWVWVTGLRDVHVGGRIVFFKGVDRLCESAPIGPIPDPKYKVDLGNPMMTNKVTNDTFLFNASFPIADVDYDPNVSLGVPLMSVRFVITDDEGNVLGNSSVQGKDEGDFCTTFSVYYSKNSVIDRFVLKGLNMSFEGALIEMFINGTSVGNESFPDEFNLTGLEVSTSFSSPDERIVGNETFYDLTVSASSERPYRKTIPWERVEARVMDRKTDTVLIDLTKPATYNGTLPEEPDILIRIHERDVNMTELWRATFYISALNRSFEDAYLELFIGDTMVGWELLDGPFNVSYPNVTINLASPNVAYVDTNGTTYYHAVLNINKIIPKDVKCYWHDITLEIVSSNGSLLISAVAVSADSGIYDTDDTNGIDFELWYIDVSGESKVSAGDAFKITGLTRAFESARVNMYLDGEKVGSIVLPSDWS